MERSEKPRPAFVLLVAAWMGLASGLVEGSFLWMCQQMRWTGYYDLVYAAVGREQIWISAVVNGVGFTVLGVFAAVTVRFLPAVWGTALVLGSFAFLTFWDWISIPARLSTMAGSVLAVGLAVQVTRMSMPRLAAVHAAMRRTLPVLAALPLVIAIGQMGWKRAAETYAVSRSPEPAASAPNVLLLVLDTVRADHTSAYGYARETTPYLTQLAREGALFASAYATSSWTLPSHASLLTGTYSFEHGTGRRADTKSIGKDLPMLAEELQRRGYSTAGFAANNIFLGEWLGFARGFGRYENLYESVKDAVFRTLYGRRFRMFRMRGRFDPPSPTTTARASLMRENFLRWLDRQPQRPFFAFINVMEAHSQFNFPPGWAMKFEGEAPHEKTILRTWEIPESRRAALHHFTNLYDNAIALADAEVRALFSELEKRGKLENTLVIITSDHGELLGEHTLNGHSNTLYEGVIRVPLLMRWPGHIPAGLVEKTPVTHRDLAGAVIDLVSEKGENPFPGARWKDWWRSASPERAAAVILAELEEANFPDTPPSWPVRNGWLKAIIRDGWKLILHQQGKMELYHVAQDPLELRDLVETPEGAPLAQKLRVELLEMTRVKKP